MTKNCLPCQVRSEARLEAQARIASLEASLRRTELDAQDRIRQAELAHFKESRASQLSVVETQNQRQRERLEREAFEEKTRDAIRKELAHAHATELAELEALRRARGVGDNDVVMSRKQVAALQQQLAELHRELQMREEQARSGGAGASAGGAASGGAGGAGFFESLFGGGSGSGGGGGGGLAEQGRSRDGAAGGGMGDREAMLSAQLEAKAAEASSLTVQLVNLKAVLSQQEQMLRMHRRAADDQQRSL
jgi:hypothetical protein